MKNLSNYVLYGILIIIVVGFLLSFTGFKMPTAKVIENNREVQFASTKQSGLNSINTGTTDDGDVSIELTPKKVVNGVLTVKVSINTHSVELNDFDLKEITTLEFNGISINPTSAPSLGGHHVSGDIIFNIEKDISIFTIKIKGIPKIEERVFTWN